MSTIVEKEGSRRRSTEKEPVPPTARWKNRSGPSADNCWLGYEGLDVLKRRKKATKIEL